MGLTIEEGQESARKRALDSTVLYQKATDKFGRLIDAFNGHAPKSLGIAHVLRVNSKLLSAPTQSRDRRRGFMYATINMARSAGVEWERLDEPLVCSYTWGRDINADSKALYQEQTALFPEPSKDFWKCAYLKHVLGNGAFSVIWGLRDLSQPTVYDSLLYAVNGLSRSLPGWPIITLKHTVLVGCPYVYELASRGGKMKSKGYGIEPVLTESQYKQVFV